MIDSNNMKNGGGKGNIKTIGGATMAHKTIFRSHMIKAAEGNKVLLSTCFFTSGRIIKRFEKWTPISLLRAAYYMGEGVETPLSADDCPLYHNGGRV